MTSHRIARLALRYAKGDRQRIGQKVEKQRARDNNENPIKSFSNHIEITIDSC